MKKTSEINRNLQRISKLGRYIKPEKIAAAIKLDSNENFVLDTDFMRSITLKAVKEVDVREYPLDQLEQLYIHLSKYTGIRKECIAAGSGSDQVIELLLSTLGSKRATVFTPTFSYFINRCELHGIKISSVPLKQEDFELDSEAFVKNAKRSDITYICSPNNPTGNQFDKNTITDIIDSLEDKMILVDEAYVDFADYSLSDYAMKYNNVIVLRTLSKAFGLAGARVGFMVANEKFTKVFRSTIQSPYPISVISLAIASSIIEHADYVKETIEIIREERSRVTDSLTRIDGIKVFRSDANFIFIETGNKYQLISKALEHNGIIVKMFGNNIAGHRGCMRVTIGTKEMNDKLLHCIEETLQR
jgi:histidinol-phosphate aminotransferase